MDGVRRLQIDSGSVDVEIQHTSGDQELSRVSGALSLETTSGDIDLADVSGVRRVSSSSGDVSANALLATEDMNYSTTSGDIEVAFKNWARELRFVLHSTSGDLEVDDYDSEDSLHIGEGELLVEAGSTSGDQRFTTQ